jgi:putative Mn2+ efflux pump MntP
MDYLFITLTALALSADTLAICTIISLSSKKLCSRTYLIPPIFGVFHALMLITGYYLSTTFHEHISTFDHWIALILLTLIGIKMIREGMSKKEEKPIWDSWKNIIALAIGTSIDALALGITFLLLKESIAIPALIIGIIVTTASYIGLFFGRKLPFRKPKKISIIGGVILIGIGIKILLGHIL